MLFLQSVYHVWFFNRHEAIGSNKTELVSQCSGFDILSFSFCCYFQLHCLDHLESLNVHFPEKEFPWHNDVLETDFIGIELRVMVLFHVCCYISCQSSLNDHFGTENIYIDRDIRSIRKTQEFVLTYKWQI